MFLNIMYNILKNIYTKNMTLFMYCFEIFFARTIEMCIGSIRTILLVKGKSILASFLAFIEIIIWFLIIKQTIVGDINIPILLSYALGYSFGTYIGVHINNKYISGFNAVVVLSQNNNKILSKIKKEKDIINTQYINSKYLMIICEKRNTNSVISLIKKVDRQSTITIIEISNIIKNNHYS